MAIGTWEWQLRASHGKTLLHKPKRLVGICARCLLLKRTSGSYFCCFRPIPLEHVVWTMDRWYQDTSSPEYSEPDGAWSWVTGESWSYTNWGPGDPSNTNGQDHAAFGGIPGNEIRFTWNDPAAPEPGGFIVEWSGASDCNGNGILDSCEVDTDLDGLLMNAILILTEGIFE